TSLAARDSLLLSSSGIKRLSNRCNSSGYEALTATSEETSKPFPVCLSKATGKLLTNFLTCPQRSFQH
ncbi:TPA: hypothetical protein ACG38M_001988, partial [Streptococcus pyogenes]